MTWLERTVGNGVWGVAIEYVTDLPTPLRQYAIGTAVGLVLLAIVYFVHRCGRERERGRRLRAAVNAVLGAVWVVVLIAMYGLAAGCSAQPPTDGGVYLVDHQTDKVEMVDQ